MIKIKLIIILVFIFSVPAVLHAESCVLPSIEERIEKADAIFVGKSLHHVTQQKQGEFTDYTVFRYRVERAWKGVSVGDELDVRANIYFGNPLGRPMYLMFVRKVDGAWLAHPCYGLHVYQYPAEEIQVLDNTLQD